MGCCQLTFLSLHHRKLTGGELRWAVLSNLFCFSFIHAYNNRYSLRGCTFGPCSVQWFFKRLRFRYPSLLCSAFFFAVQEFPPQRRGTLAKGSVETEEVAAGDDAEPEGGVSSVFRSGYGFGFGFVRFGLDSDKRSLPEQNRRCIFLPSFVRKQLPNKKPILDSDSVKRFGFG